MSNHPIEVTAAVPHRGIRRALARWFRRLAIAGLVGLPLVYFGIPHLVELPEGLDRPPPPTQVITDRHGVPLRRPLGDDGTRNGRVDLAAVPPGLIDAVLVAEDKRFFQHGGVDFLATARAIRGWVTGAPNPGGASTITQQLIKLSTADAPADRTLRRKLHEVFAARKLEMRWSKDAILTAYLERVPFGNLHRGVTEASRGYFGKPLGDLSAGECALLAAIPNAPGRLNPYRNPAACQERQHLIIDRAVAAGLLDPDAGARAKTQPLQLRPRGAEFAAPHFVDFLLAKFDRALPRSGVVTTTLELGLQQTCETIVRDHVRALADKNVTSGAAVVIENETGDVVALVGSPDYDAAAGGQVNGATSPRSPGSALKPFVYLLGFEQGLSPGTVIADTPLSIPTSTGIYSPTNFDNTFRGPVTVRTALATSLNIPATRTLREVGGPSALVGRLGELGVTTPDKPTRRIRARPRDRQR